ncbi:MAG: hypothetical protein IKY83_04655 [Proteobacteria bacterium]|nr:hypothetical protein [Pseudomonadota bacterium]
MAEEEVKSGNRGLKAKICIVLILACFVAHYVITGTGMLEGQSETVKFFVEKFLPQCGNSGIVFLLLWWFGAPMAAKFVADRKKTIEHDIDESMKAKEAAEASYKETELKLAHLNSEKEQMRRSYEESAEEESARLEEEAKRTAERLEKDAAAAFELQAGLAKRQFEADMMGQALDRAREEIVRRVSADSALRDRLIDQSIASLKI